MRQSKRNLAASLAGVTGMSELLGILPARPLLLVLNYHRIGSPEDTPYHPGLFSATPAQLDAQIGFLKSRFDVLTLAEAIAAIDGALNVRRACVLVTFDDGYIDNYEIAFPILRSHGVQAVFFLPTAYVGANRLPWWDTIAYIVKNSRRRAFRLTYPAAVEFDLSRQGLGRVLMLVSDLYKAPQMRDGERFLVALEAACDTPRPDDTQRCFINWEEAAAMSGGGMAIGSHAHSHEILSKLTEQEQFEELSVSKRILEERLGVDILALAYPVGTRGSYSSETCSAAARAGYRVAFSLHGGFNRWGAMERYNVGRQAVDADATLARFKLQTSLAAVTGKYWF